MSQKLSSAPSMSEAMIEFGEGVRLENAFSQELECHSSEKRRERKLRRKNKKKKKTFIFCKEEVVKADS